MIRNRYRAIKNYSFILSVNLLHKYKNFQSYQGASPLSKTSFYYRIMNTSTGQIETQYTGFRVNI